MHFGKHCTIYCVIKTRIIQQRITHSEDRHRFDGRKFEPIKSIESKCTIRIEFASNGHKAKTKPNRQSESFPQQITFAYRARKRASVASDFPQIFRSPKAKARQFFPKWKTGIRPLFCRRKRMTYRACACIYWADEDVMSSRSNGSY